MEKTLPIFRYFPDPIAMKALTPTDASCDCCQRKRGYLTQSPLYAKEEAFVCPWCVADGSASEYFEGIFTEVDNPSAIGATEVEKRTPSFETWQEIIWPSHCNEMMIYRGPPTIEQARGYDWNTSDDSIDLPEEEILQLVKNADQESSPRFYLFECICCKKASILWDWD